MPDRTYTLVYDAESARAAAAAVDQLIARVTQLDKLCDQVQPKFKALFSGSSRGINTTGKAVTGLTGNLTSLQNQAGKTGLAVATMGANVQAAGVTARGAATQVGSLGTTAEKSAGGMRRLATAGAGLSAVVGLAGSLSDALKEAREYGFESAEAVLKLRDAVRELKMTLGKDTTTKEAAEQVKTLMLASGADQKAAVAFDTMWESTVFASKKSGNWGLNDKQTLEAKKQALAYAVSSGMSEKTIGEVVPLIGVGEKITSTDQLLGKLGTMGQLAVEGVGNLTPMMQVYQKLRGTMVRPGGGGAFRTSEELLGAISATSVDAGGVGRVTQSMQQVWRDLSFADNDEKVKTFEKYGLKPGDDFQTRVRKIAPLLDEARANNVGELEALKKAGFSRIGSNPKTVMAVFDRKILDANMEIARKAPDGAGVRAQNLAFRRENPNRFAENARAVARMNTGEEFADLAVLRKFAEAQAENAKVIKSGYGNFAENVIDMKVPGIVPFVGGKSLSQDLLGQESAREKVLDVITSQHVLKAVPGAAERFPDLSGQLDVPGVNRLNPTFQPARGARLAAILRQLSPEERARGAAAGTPVEVGGEVWHFAAHVTPLAEVWGRLYDANLLAGRYDPDDVLLAALKLLTPNYDLTLDEAVAVVRAADPAALVRAVEEALFGPEERHRTYPGWVASSLWSNGVDPASVPPEHLRDVLDQLVLTGRAVPASKFVSAAEAAAVLGGP